MKISYRPETISRHGKVDTIRYINLRPHLPAPEDLHPSPLGLAVQTKLKVMEAF
ncbi:predicted protein [Botrytis cinerea T4]|uniref:Uncharacterized protein n=1 Tax=Botryotinia fuckeliana (strain T4) TaxID=999810 RepID=G2XY51_BOTF4|nr:predicted protein [Botrytis cinerea T4]